MFNSYPTEKNPHSQVFIRNMKENLEKQTSVSVDVCYNKIFDYWKGANRKKDIFSNLIKYSVFIVSMIYFLIRRKKKIDILFPQAIIFPTVFASFIKKMFNIPMVGYVHGGDVNAYSNASSLYQSLMKNALLNCDSVIVNSTDMQKKVFEISRHHDIRIISPGVDTNTMIQLDDKSRFRRKYSLPENKKILLAAGNAIRRKGFDVLLKALKQLDKNTLESIFVLILTEGPERGDLEQFIIEHRLKDYVNILDKVKQEELNEYYNAADVFIFPSREEPLGLVGIEAMAAGTIVLASNVGGIPDYIEDGKNGFLFERENDKELSEQITYFLDQKNGSLNTMRDNMNSVVQSHSLERSSKSIVILFENLIRK